MLWEGRRRPSIRSAVALPILAVLLLVSGCATGRPKPADPESLWKDYEQAVEAARYPQPGRVSKGLVPIAAYTPGLVWSQETPPRVLMAAWTQAKFYTGTPPYDTTVPVNLWMTAAPFLQKFCQKTGLQGDALRLRLAQRLGLRPDATYDAFVQMWVDPRTFFRPCPDPEINDHECQVNLTAGPVDQGSSCPWSAALQDQLSGRFVQVDSGQLGWMCSNWTSSYLAGEPRKSYPWTALGYTYDWGAKSFYGESEFVLTKSSSVTVQSVTPTDAYCARGGAGATPGSP